MRVDIDAITYQEAMADGGRLVVIAALQSLPYPEYLRTNHWDDVRRMVWKRSRGNCERLGCTARMRDVHHLKYDNLGMESDCDVEGLCPEHHKEFHDTWTLAVHIEGRKQFLE